jgi:hypothetical protein
LFTAIQQIEGVKKLLIGLAEPFGPPGRAA